MLQMIYKNLRELLICSVLDKSFLKDLTFRSDYYSCWWVRGWELLKRRRDYYCEVEEVKGYLLVVVELGKLVEVWEGF